MHRAYRYFQECKHLKCLTDVEACTVYICLCVVLVVGGLRVSSVPVQTLGTLDCLVCLVLAERQFAAWLLQQPLSRFRAHSDSLRLHTSPLIHFLRPTTALSRVTNLTSQNIKLIKGHSTLGFHFFFFNKVIYLQSQGALVESVEPIRGEVLI